MQDCERLIVVDFGVELHEYSLIGFNFVSHIFESRSAHFSDTPLPS
jgi:hypothetical protein